MRYCRNFAKAGLKLSQYMVAAQESINSRFCSVVEINLSFFLKGGHLRGQALVVKSVPKTTCLKKLLLVLPVHFYLLGKKGYVLNVIPLLALRVVASNTILPPWHRLIARFGENKCPKLVNGHGKSWFLVRESHGKVMENEISWAVATLKGLGAAWMRQEPSPGRIIYKGTHSHTQSYNNMSTSSKFISTLVIK